MSPLLDFLVNKTMIITKKKKELNERKSYVLAYSGNWSAVLSASSWPLSIDMWASLCFRSLERQLCRAPSMSFSFASLPLGSFGSEWALPSPRLPQVPALQEEGAYNTLSVPGKGDPSPILCLSGCPGPRGDL